jgi:arylsulfatase A
MLVLPFLSQCFWSRSAFFVLFAIVAFGAVNTRAAAPPNIIVILADDLGYGDLSCFGQENFKTPRLDEMASQGMRFTSHYAGCTVCAPSRACMLTGKHMGHVTIRGNGPNQLRENPQDITIATHLGRAGYYCALIGKSGLSGNTDDGELAGRKGFDHFFGFTSHAAAHRYYPQRLWRNGERVQYPGNHGKEGETYTGDLFLADTLRFLDERAAGDKPFFLHLSLQQPHADLQVPDEWRNKFIGKYDETPYKGNGYRAEAHPKATFVGMVSYLDDTVGKVLDKLRETGMAENTLVIFSSDNGAMNEGGWSREYFDSSGPLRGGKRDLYEGGIRVPTIAWWPETVAPGTTTDHVSGFWDYLPTACELAGAEMPDDTDGLSLVPTLTGKGKQAKHDYCYWEFYERGGKQAVRWGDWKGIRLGVNKNRKAPLELYNLANDLGEQHDLAAEHPDIVAKLAAMMAEAHEPSELFQFGNRRGG